LNRQTPLFLRDPWLASSLLQKAIRRGEIELAEQAATALLRLRGSPTWRRFIVIAIEDVGIAALEVLSEVVSICSDRQYRGRLRGDEEAARYLARKLACAPKDRSADLLMSAIRHHLSLETTRKEVAALLPHERLAWVEDPSKSLYEKSAAAWPANGVRYTANELGLSLSLFGNLGAPQELIETVAGAESRTREPFCALLPLLWLTASRGLSNKTACSLPPTRTVGGVPLWTLDFHTRAGRAAIQRFLRENELVRQALRGSVAHNRYTEASYLAAFYTDAASCTLCLDWSLSTEIEQLGMEADFAHAGVPPERVGPLLSLFKSQINHLNDIREEVLVRYLEGV